MDKSYPKFDSTWQKSAEVEKQGWRTTSSHSELHLKGHYQVG